MQRAYSIWKAFETFVVEAVYAYVNKADDCGWPPVVIMALPAILLIAAQWLGVPRWILVSLCMTVFIPMAWHLASMIYTFIALNRGNGRR